MSSYFKRRGKREERSVGVHSKPQDSHFTESTLETFDCPHDESILDLGDTDTDSVQSLICNETIGLSSYRSVKGRNYKEKKRHFREMLGLEESVTGKSIRVEQDSSMAEDKGFHYFWWSPFWIAIYVVLLSTIILREPVLLHGITIIVTWRIVACVLGWGSFVTRSRDLKAGIKRLEWMTKFAFRNVERTIDGHRFRGYLTTKTVHFWAAGTGKSFALSFLRKQSQEMRAREIKEKRQYLENSLTSFNESIRSST
mmetsp:Transcript_111528/g.322375  ORF Transcript_111528/g.322375 Transcript_111528/m.322375 type:complete len:255 (+) Transcript_111528:220-984(+)